MRIVEPLRGDAAHSLVAFRPLDHVPERDPLRVAHQELRVEIVRVPLAQVSEEVVESLPPRRARGFFHAQAPLAHQSGGVSRFLEQFGDGHILAQEARGSVPTDPCVTGVLARHQHAARRRANGESGVCLSETHALGGHPVEVRRLDSLLAVRAEVSVAQVVSQDPDDVRRRFRGPGRFGARAASAGKKKQCESGARNSQDRHERETKAAFQSKRRNARDSVLLRAHPSLLHFPAARLMRNSPQTGTLRPDPICGATAFRRAARSPPW